MKHFIWMAFLLLALAFAVAACSSPETTAEPAVESGSEQMEPAEVAAEPEAVAEIEAEPVADSGKPSAQEVAQMEAAAAEAVRAENRAPTFRGDNDQEEAEDVAAEEKSLADYLPILGPAPEVINGEAWINSDPLTLESLKGKVVLIEFWTYS